MNVTLYERVSSSMMSIVFGLVIACIVLSVIWSANRIPSQQDAVPLEMIELAGGAEDGAIDETLQLESPEEEIPDPSVAETPTEETQVEEVLENVVELADQASSQAEKQFDLDAQTTGKAGSASGTGRRALGMGPGQGGMPREQRWFVQFSDQATLKEYAQQLESLGIEMGLLRDDGSVVYLSQLSSGRPKARTSNSGKDEKRLYMTWQGGNRRSADLQLFRQAGVSVGTDLIMHFYSPQTESQLAILEKQYRNQPISKIRRTYFVVRGDKSGYRFIVTRQTYFR